MHLSSRNNLSALADKPHWTLADFFSTYRYWALFIAVILVGIGTQGLNVIMPLISDAIGNSAATIGIFYISIPFGWILGTLIAVTVTGSHERATVITPIVISIAVAGAAILMPTLLMSPLFLGLFGLTQGALLTFFPFMTVIFLMGKRSSRNEFFCALVVLLMAMVPSFFGPIVARAWDVSDQTIWGFISCFMGALLILLPCKKLSFDHVPPIRHKPLPPRKRSPCFVAWMTLLPAIALVLAFLLIWPQTYFLQSELLEQEGHVGIALITRLAVVITLALSGVTYLGYWMYRIHGELAGVSASQRLLTPRPAALVALFVPLGMPLLLITLGNLLNDRTRCTSLKQAISILPLGIFSFFIPPIAMAMIQRAANKSYGNL